GDYTVTWTSSPTATSYTLEEDTFSSFTNATVIYTGPDLFYDVENRLDGNTYYYRVCATNPSGASPWTLAPNGCTVSLQPIFEAQVVSVVSAPVIVLPGGTFQTLWTIRNTGGAAGSTPYTLVLSDNGTATVADPQLYSGTSSSIAPGTTETRTVICTVPSTTTPGNYYAGLYVDAAASVCTANRDIVVQTPPPEEEEEDSEDDRTPGILWHASPVPGVPLLPRGVPLQEEESLKHGPVRRKGEPAFAGSGGPSPSRGDVPLHSPSTPC
ncbi:MAG: hypothetical protein ACYTHM_09875, partial [Planctomycetota bacterium]